METVLIFSLGFNLLLGVLITMLLIKNKKTKSNPAPAPAHGKTISKKFLEANYYWEFKTFFDSLPENLPIPKNPVKKVNNRVMTEKEMTEGHTFFSKEEAFGLASKMVQDKKEGIVWLEDEDGGLCEVGVWFRGDYPSVSVYEFSPSRGWNDGACSFFRN